MCFLAVAILGGVPASVVEDARFFFGQLPKHGKRGPFVSKYGYMLSTSQTDLMRLCE